MIEFASGQINGRRHAQEDSLDVLRLDDGLAPDGPGVATGGMRTSLKGGLVMVVADGMGGHVGGRVASSICVSSFLGAIRSSGADWEQRLEAGLTAANDALRAEVSRSPELNGMGSTLVGAVVGDQGLGWISIGDSALYHFHDGTLTRLNEDHSFGAYLDQQARQGLMTSAAAAADRRRNHLFYALLGDDLDHYERFSGFRALEAGDIVLAASDGLKTLSDDRVADILTRLNGGSIDGVVTNLLDAVEAEGRERQDNVSIIAARVVQESVGSRSDKTGDNPRDIVTLAPATLPTAADASDPGEAPGPLSDKSSDEAPRPQSRARQIVAIVILITLVLGAVVLGLSPNL